MKWLQTMILNNFAQLASILSVVAHSLALWRLVTYSCTAVYYLNPLGTSTVIFNPGSFSLSLPLLTPASSR